MSERAVDFGESVIWQRWTTSWLAVYWCRLLKTESKKTIGMAAAARPNFKFSAAILPAA